MPKRSLSGDEAVAAVIDGSSAQDLLRAPSLAVLSAISERIDELRFQDPPAALEVADLALAALDRVPHGQRRGAVSFGLWSAYGSACRAMAHFQAAERALLTAARIGDPTDLRLRAEVAERLAYLRADQGRKAETLNLVEFFLAQARPGGGVQLGRRLAGAASLILRFNDYHAAGELATEALSLLPPNGDRYQLSAISSIAHASLGTPSRRAILAAIDLVHKSRQRVEAGSFPWLRLHWIAGNLWRSQPLERYEESLEALGVARAGFEQKGDPVDRALLIVDLAELHLDRGVPEDARDLARHSFGVLSDLRNWPEAYRALRSFYRAATDLELERSLLDSVRQRLLSARR